MPKRILQGVVISDKQQKTLVVKVERRFTHPLLKKTVRKSKNYHAHVENKTQKVGDTVSIEETKPISKLKRWIVINEPVKPAEAKTEAAKPAEAVAEGGTSTGVGGG
jgi:small subunit ribosomal protein S17